MEGQIKRSKKLLAIRGLNQNHNHDLKNIFKGAAIRAAGVAEAFPGFLRCARCQRAEASHGASDSGAEDCSDHSARLEERSAFRRPTSETTSSLSVCGEPYPSLDYISSGGPSGSSGRSGSRVSIHNGVGPSCSGTESLD